MDKQLTDRQKRIFSIILDSYVETAEPVGSRTIAKKYHLDLSPATIRNEMSELEEAGLITHRHTSAGRVPTDLGYRFFINYLLQHETISQELAGSISREFRKEMEGLDDLLEKTTRILSAVTEQASIVIYPEMKDLIFSQIGLHRLSGTHVMAVWMGASGLVHNQMIDMREDVSEDTLKKITHFFNQELSGVAFGDMKDEILRRLSERKDSLAHLYRQALQITEDSLKKIQAARLRLEGAFHILEKPEFQDVAKTRLLLQALDQKDKLCHLLREDANDAGIRVHIGRENQWQEIWDCSLITAAYQWGEGSSGVIGILGPSRMRYGMAMALVSHISKELSLMLGKYR